METRHHPQGNHQEWWDHIRYRHGLTVDPMMSTEQLEALHDHHWGRHWHHAQLGVQRMDTRKVSEFQGRVVVEGYTVDQVRHALQHADREHDAKQADVARNLLDDLRTVLGDIREPRRRHTAACHARDVLSEYIGTIAHGDESPPAATEDSGPMGLPMEPPESVGDGQGGRA